MPILELEQNRSTTRRVLLTAGSGVILGLLLGIPPAYAGHAMGFSMAPFGIAVLLAGLVVGILLTILIATFLFENPVIRIRAVRLPPAVSASKSRLAREKAILDRLDSRFEKVAEQKIIWSELLDLELQDIDEQMSRIRRGG